MYSARDWHHNFERDGLIKLEMELLRIRNFSLFRKSDMQIDAGTTAIIFALYVA